MILTFVDALPNIYLIIAITFSTFFVLQSLLAIIGNLDDVGADADSDMDFDEDFDVAIDEDVDFDVDEDIGFDEDVSVRLGQSSTPFYLFSLRSILSFLILFGWTGVLLSGGDIHYGLVVLYAIGVGFIAMVSVSYLVFVLNKLSADATMKFEDTIGKEGFVYLHIPGRGNGMGKVQLVVADSLKTLDAISTDTEIQTGKKVKVIELQKNILVVEEIIKTEE